MSLTPRSGGITSAGGDERVFESNAVELDYLHVRLLLNEDGKRTYLGERVGALGQVAAPTMASPRQMCCTWEATGRGRLYSRRLLKTNPGRAFHLPVRRS